MEVVGVIRLQVLPARDNSGADCETDAGTDGHLLPAHIERCTCDTHHGVCQVCGFKITVGPSGIEYGHARATNRGPDEDGVRRDCPHRPSECDPTGPAAESYHTKGGGSA